MGVTLNVSENEVSETLSREQISQRIKARQVRCTPYIVNEVFRILSAKPDVPLEAAYNLVSSPGYLGPEDDEDETDDDPSTCLFAEEPSGGFTSLTARTIVDIDYHGEAFHQGE